DSASWRALTASTREEPIEAGAQTRPPTEDSPYAMNAFGAVFVDVRVDPDLGSIRIARVVGAYDVGRILNEKTTRSQAMGGIVYGLSMALHEHTAVDSRTGRYLNTDLSEYLVPVHADMPEIDIVFIDEPDPQVSPIGVKGLGEIGTTGVAAAVANAVWHATGIRVRDLPLTLDKVLQLSESA